MTEALLVSNLVLWVLVVVLAIAVFALTRQIGLLHERIAPVGALAVDQGPKVGEAVPETSSPTLAGSELVLGGTPGGASPTRTLLFFLSPTCPVCKTLLPTLARIAREEGETLRLLLASDGPPDEHRGFAEREGLEPGRYLLSRELGLRFEVSKLPYAVLIDAEGIVRAKGIVNTREHLESLFEAERLAAGSLQDYALAQTREPTREQTAFEVLNGGASR